MPDKCMISVDEVWLPNPSGLEVAYTVMDKYALRDLDYKLHREIRHHAHVRGIRWCGHGRHDAVVLGYGGGPHGHVAELTGELD